MDLIIKIGLITEKIGDFLDAKNYYNMAAKYLK